MGAGQPGPARAPEADLAETGSEGQLWPRRVVLPGAPAWGRSPTGSAADAMSPIVKRDSCFSPVLCHCKAACSNRTLSLAFGCKNRPAAVQGCPHPPQPVCMHPGCMNPALMNSPWYQYQEDDSVQQDHGFPRLTHEVQTPELMHAADKNALEPESVHGYASHSHISPLKEQSMEMLRRWK